MSSRHFILLTSYRLLPGRQARLPACSPARLEKPSMLRLLLLLPLCAPALSGGPQVPEGQALELEVDHVLGGFKGDVQLSTFHATFPGIGKFHLSGFKFAAVRLSREGGLNLPPDTKAGSLLTFEAKFNHLLIEYEELRLTIGDITEIYRVVGSANSVSFHVSLNRKNCSALAQLEEVANKTIKIVPTREDSGNSLLGLAEVLTEWLAPAFWRHLSAELERAIADGLNSGMRGRPKFCDTAPARHPHP